MMTITLIDSENLGKDWIAAASAFPADLHLVFFTRHSAAIPIEDLPRIVAALPHIEFIECCTGSNALDFQLVTELGYRLANAPDTEYVILAKDTGYDAAVRYWRSKGFHVRRLPSAKAAVSAAEPAPAAVPAPAEPAETEAPAAELPAEEPAMTESPVSEEAENSASALPGDAPTEEAPAPAAAEPAGSMVPASPAEAPAPKKRGRKPKAKPAEKTPAAEKSTVETPAVQAASSPKKEPVSEKEAKPAPAKNSIPVPAELVERLQAAAGFKEAAQAEALGRLILEHAGADEAKRLQETYQAIISRYGQKRGLDYYRKSKDIIKKLSGSK